MRKVAAFLLFTLGCIFSPLLTTAAPNEIPDPSVRGPFEVSNAQYKLEAKIDPSVLEGVQTELWSRVFWPKDLSKPRPLLVFLHGNHGTCGSGTKPRKDSDCTYTSKGTCPSGMVITPNHEGYNYLARHLAGHGYIVVSINANRGITCGDGESLDWSLNLARGRLVLRHLQELNKWSTTGGAPKSLGLGERGLVGKIDFDNVGLFGHSRGGEGMRAAYNLYRDPESPWPAKVPRLNVKGIYEIGATDGQAPRELNADSTAWNQLLPMCDGDVSDLQGKLVFERMIRMTFERRPSPKSTYMAWGTNHNYFNTEWQENDAYSCDGHESIYGDGYQSVPQQKIALASATSFFLAHVGTNRQTKFATHFDPAHPLPKWVTELTRVDRDFIPTFDARWLERLEEFVQPTGTSTRHQTNEARGINIEHIHATPFHAKVAWTKASTETFLQLNWTALGEGQSPENYASFDFRILRQTQHSGSKEPTDFSIYLVDDQNRLSQPVRLSQVSQLLGPANSTDAYQTIRIPLSSFGLARNFRARGARFVFDRSEKGGIRLANVRFTAPFTYAVAGAMPALELEQTHPALVAKNDTPLRELKAELLSVSRVNRSRFLKNTDAIEVSVRAPDRFPVTDSVPELHLGERIYRVSRFPEGNTSVLVFSVPASEVSEPIEVQPISVRYSRTRWMVQDQGQ